MCTYYKQVGQGFSSLLLSLTLISLFTLYLFPFPSLFLPSPFLFPPLLSLFPLFLLQLAGIVYMSPRVAEIMLGLHTLPPLDACTYVGLDNGAQPLSVSENIQFLKSSAFLFLSPCSSMCTTTFLYSSKLYMLTPLLLTLIYFNPFTPH